MNTRIVTRVIIYKDDKILLSRNEGADYWYPGGGGLEEDENLMECAAREVKEETGQDVEIKNLLYTQEFYVNKDERYIEFFFLAEPRTDSKDNHFHKDVDTDNRVVVVENKWFSEEEAGKVKIYPAFMEEAFWRDIKIHNIDKKNFWIGEKE